MQVATPASCKLLSPTFGSHKLLDSTTWNFTANCTEDFMADFTEDFTADFTAEFTGDFTA